MANIHNNTQSDLDKNNIIHLERLPEPKALEKYDSMISNGGNRFMTIEEKKVENRIITENKLIDNKFLLDKRGQLFKFIIALIILANVIYLTLTSGALFRSAIVSSVIVIILRRLNYLKKSA